MAERHPGKLHPAHRVPEHVEILYPPPQLPLNDLQTSTGDLREHVGARKEHDRIVNLLNQEQEATREGWITYDRIRMMIDEKG